jgi:adenylate cyclase
LALFADVSGFTALTEALTRELGLRGGAEELTRQLNRVYDALTAEVDRFRGSVIGFAGDAITCWFDDADPSGFPQPGGSLEPGTLRAVTCARACQQAMQPFAQIKLPAGGTTALAVKTAVASGPARRFLVGDPAVQLVDALAGETVARMAFVFSTNAR